MRVTLYEPALAVGGKAYAGWANEGDELFFPHVDTCCAVMIYGNNAIVGGHMGSQLPSMRDPNYEMAGRYVWELVLANHQRLNDVDKGCKVVTIGESNWYSSAVQTIWGAVKQARNGVRFTLQLKNPSSLLLGLTAWGLPVQGVDRRGLRRDAGFSIGS